MRIFEVQIFLVKTSCNNVAWKLVFNIFCSIFLNSGIEWIVRLAGLDRLSWRNVPQIRDENAAHIDILPTARSCSLTILCSNNKIIRYDDRPRLLRLIAFG